MNIHLIKCSLFRDESKLRLTGDGRLLVKTEISKQLNICDKKNISCVIQSIDPDRKLLKLLFGVERVGRSSKLWLNDIGGVKVLTLKKLISQIAEVKAQYTSYEPVDGGSFLVHLNYETLKM